MSNINGNVVTRGTVHWEARGRCLEEWVKLGLISLNIDSV